MKIKAIRNFMHEGKPIAEGASLEVPEREAQYLIYIGKAKAAKEKPEQATEEAISAKKKTSKKK